MLDTTESTCWTLIQGAAKGEESAQTTFVCRYDGMVRSYLRARWRRSRRLDDLDDAVQEVFLDCFRQGGVLERVEPEHPTSFRAFLYGVSRRVALRFESARGRRRERQPPSEMDIEAQAVDEERLSRVFDRTWAKAVLSEAVALQVTVAQQAGGRAAKRVDLLRLRTREGLPVREIARLWGEDRTFLHREYALARREFRRALKTVLARHGSESEPITLEELSAMIASRM